METICSSETSVDARSTQRHIPEDDILKKKKKFDFILIICSVNYVDKWREKETREITEHLLKSCELSQCGGDNTEMCRVCNKMKSILLLSEQLLGGAHTGRVSA
jgi:hypothetical protein